MIILMSKKSILRKKNSPIPLRCNACDHHWSPRINDHYLYKGSLLPIIPTNDMNLQLNDLPNTEEIMKE